MWRPLGFSTTKILPVGHVAPMKLSIVTFWINLSKVGTQFAGHFFDVHGTFNSQQ